MEKRSIVGYEAPRADALELKIEDTVMNSGGGPGSGEIPPGGEEPA